jgi:arylformamidase
MIYDISRRIAPKTAVFPGDTPYSAKLNWSMAKGAPVNLVTVHMSPHVGTHADAYYHYTPDGTRAAEMPLENYVGRALLVSVSKHEGALTLADLPPLPERLERLLIRSHISDLPDEVFPQRFPYPSPHLIGDLAARGVMLIGIDAPSVDPFDSFDLPSHNALRQHRMVNLECLVLRGVPDGEYELIAPPLKLDGACASPVRALLRTLA